MKTKIISTAEGGSVRGVSFLLPGDWGKCLFDILDCIGIEKFYWLIDDDEIHTQSENPMDAFLFKYCERFISGTELKKLVSEQDYLAIFVKLQGYTCEKMDSAFNCYDVGAYEDFLKSNCDIVLLIADAAYCEFYAKDSHIIEAMYKNAKKRNWTEVELTTNENDGRTGFYI
jgi:hypothetical protein